MKKQTWMAMGLGLVLSLSGCGWEHPNLPEDTKTSDQRSGTSSSSVAGETISVKPAEPAVNPQIPKKITETVQTPATKGSAIPVVNITTDTRYLGHRSLRSSWVQRVGQEIVPGGVTTSAVRFNNEWYVVGYFTGTIDIQGERLTSAGGEDGFIARFNSYGGLQWAIPVGGKGNDRVLHITRGCRNQLFVVGSFAQEMVLGRDTLKTSAASDGFIAELTDSARGPGLVRAKAAGFEQGGNFHQIAVSPSTCHLFLAQLNQSGLSIVSWSSDQWGTPQWTLTIQTSGSSGLRDLQIDTTGHLVVLGTFFRWAAIGPKHTLSGYGIFMACFNTTGEVKWVVPIQNPSQRSTSAFKVVISGEMDRVVFVGAPLSDLMLDDKKFAGQVFVVAFNLQGKYQWVTALPEAVVPEGIVFEQGRTHILGRFNKPLQLGNDSLALPAGHTSARLIATLDEKGTATKAQVVMAHESVEEQGEQEVSAFSKGQDGEFLVVGNFRGEIKSGTLAAYDKTNAFFMLKTTAQGLTQWLKASGNGNSEALVRAATVDKQGYIYRVITFAGKITVGDQSFDSMGQWTHALLKQEQQGKLVWVQWFRALPVNYWSSSLRMTLGAKGGVVVAGGLSGCAQFGRTSLCSSVDNGYLARWSADGNFLGARLLRDTRRINEQPISQVDDVAQTVDGTITVVYREFNQAYLSQWTEELSWIQELPFGSASYPNRTVLAVDAQANVYLQGGSYAPNLQFGHISLQTEKDPQWHGTISGFVAKLNRTGQFVWAKSWWNELLTSGRYIHSDENGNLTITGAFRGTAKFGNQSLTSGRYDTDGFVAQLDTNGQVRWAFSFHTAEAYADPNDYYYTRDESGLTLTQDASGHIYLLGSFYRGVQIGKFAIQSKQRGAQFLAKISPTGEVQWAEHTNASIGRLHVDGEHILLFGQAPVAELWFGPQSFNLPNNNSDIYARMTAPSPLQ